jgi:chromate transport protein ChrA
VTSETLSNPSSGAKRALVIVLAVIAVVALVLGILWMVGAAPHFLDSGSHVKHGKHLFRGIAGIVVAVVCGAGAWWTNKK